MIYNKGRPQNERGCKKGPERIRKKLEKEKPGQGETGARKILEQESRRAETGRGRKDRTAEQLKQLVIAFEALYNISAEISRSRRGTRCRNGIIYGDINKEIFEEQAAKYRNAAAEIINALPEERQRAAADLVRCINKLFCAYGQRSPGDFDFIIKKIDAFSRTGNKQRTD